LPFAFLFLACALSAQVPDHTTEIVIGRAVGIRSNILQQQREISVSLPDGYDSTTERYPVVYVLDGESNFEYTAAIVHFLAAAERAPAMIVVGINSGEFSQRTHDLTPPTTAVVDNRFTPGGGGADSFLSFLANEPIPYIDKSFRTRPYRILIGHSFGGLFAIHALVTRPDIFNAYIAIDPTLSWNDGAEVGRAASFISQQSELPVDIYVTSANNFGSATPEVRRFVSLLDGKTPQGLHWTFEWMETEDHISIPLRSVYAGLDKIFDGWHLTNPLELYDAGGLEAIDTHFIDGGKRYGYTDRTTPPNVVPMVIAGLIKTGRLDEASAVLLRNPAAFPPAWNQLDALARAYESRGDTQSVIRFYRMSLDANPENDWAKQKLVQLGATPK